MANIELTREGADNLVSILNYIIEKNGYDVSETGFGYNPKTLEISVADGTDINDALKELWNDILIEEKYGRNNHS